MVLYEKNRNIGVESGFQANLSSEEFLRLVRGKSLLHTRKQ